MHLKTFIVPSFYQRIKEKNASRRSKIQVQLEKRDALQPTGRFEDFCCAYVEEIRLSQKINKQ